MITSYKSARIADVVTAETVEAIQPPTIDAAKGALSQWMQDGDRIQITHRDDGLMTAITIVCPDGEPSDVFAQLAV